MSHIFHITASSAWDEARATGAYEPPSLEQEGFIHFSGADQVVAVANRAFRGQRDLVLLCVATERLAGAVRYEHAEDAGEAFPHLYGPLNLDAVSWARPIVEGADGFGSRARRGPCDRSRRAGRNHLAGHGRATPAGPYALRTAAASWSPRRSIDASRILNFWTLPVIVIGNWSTNNT